MANTISNNKISNVVASQLPFFVRNDHPNFLIFLEKYYEYLEQNDKVINKIKNIQRYRDIDLTEDEYAEKLYDTFLKYLPKDTLADRKILIKHIKDFYRAKGTEKSTRFLLRALYDLEIDFYYPKKDILRASDGKWFVQKTLRVTDTKIANVSNSSLAALEKYIGTKIYGVTSNSSATIEKVDRFFEQGTQIDELILSNIDGTFRNGEKIYSIFNDVESLNYISSNIFSGIINIIEVTNGGSLYSVGNPVVIVSNTGVGAFATVSAVTTGDISTITVYNGGAGFRANDYLQFSGGGGAGANAIVTVVTDDSSIHPNSYNIVASTISLEANTALNNTTFSNLNSSNVNTTIANAVSFWSYANTGPVKTVLILNSGSNYSSKPDISVYANSVIQSLGILGRMEIINGGQNYKIGDVIEFKNVFGGYGTGAIANVTNVDNSKSNSISQVKFQSLAGHIIGGSGYNINYLPKANVISATGNDANIIVTALLGTSANLIPTTSNIGSILKITVSNRGSGYDSNTKIDLSGSGDGKATANVTTIGGTYSYPGRYLNDDGHISSYNFLQDRDYYQIFSYVIKSDQSVSKYRQAVKEIIHPAGMKLFGEYNNLNENTDINYSPDLLDTNTKNVKIVSYTLSNTLNISYTSHGLSQNNSIFLEFISGNIANYAAQYPTYDANLIYKISNNQTNSFTVYNRERLPGFANTRNISSDITVASFDVYYREDGKVVYISPYTTKIVKLDLPVKYDIFSAKINSISNLRSTITLTGDIDTQITGIEFNPSGNVLYTVGNVKKYLQKFTLSEAWNVNSASIVATSNIDAKLGIINPLAIRVHPSESAIYVADPTTDRIFQLNLSESGNINSVSSTVLSPSMTSIESNMQGISFDSTGTRLYITGVKGLISQYSLSTSWNVNTATYVTSSINIASALDSPVCRGISIANTGNSFIMVTESTNKYYIVNVPVKDSYNANSAFYETDVGTVAVYRNI